MIKTISQTELAMRGSYGVDLVPGISPSLWSRSAAELPAKIPPPALLLFTVLGEGRARLVHAKWSVAPLSMVKHDGFVTFLLPRPLGASWVPWVLLGASWVPPGCLLGAFWEPLGSLCLVLVPAECLLGASIS